MFTLQQTKDAVVRVILLHPAGQENPYSLLFETEVPDDEDAELIVHRDKPVCVVGHVLVHLGAQNLSIENGESLSSHQEALRDVFDERAGYFLAALQEEADAGKSWVQALALASAEVPNEA